MDDVFTIDELAAVTGVPTRTIRQYQTLGLLSPPSRVGRVGRYDASHRERLQAIGRLQERGYSLAGMRDLFDAWDAGGELRTVIGGGDNQPQAPVDEAAMRISHQQLLAAVPSFAKPANRRIAVETGLLTRATDKQSWIVRSPAALAMIADLIAAGMPVSQSVNMHAHISIVLESLGRDIAVELVMVEPAEQRASLLQRNRPLLGRAVATLLISAVGNALPAADTDRIRIGAIDDRQGSRAKKP
jgi:DNA-binding transcriptional MerR regulator